MTELRIVHGGEPTAAELAAVVAVLTARARAVAAEPSRSLRPALSPWVASGLVKGTRTRA